eukprot:TRINITY_DN69422_c0_g1_i1.p1 TRINITY_DN69422_c0_g1~~TRINITY_DN69422_c0_g1_i1.p1  ORF type:complete len:588 (-),score=96.55 TRINITY_DN69422_c0_g1_i1:334-2034(-)
MAMVPSSHEGSCSAPLAIPPALARVNALLQRCELPIFAVDAHGAPSKDHLLNHSIFNGVPVEAKQAALDLLSTDEGAVRAAGALLGTAIGDAVGAVLEFQDVVDYVEDDDTSAIDLVLDWQCVAADCLGAVFEGRPCWVPASSSTCPYCQEKRPEKTVTTLDPSRGYNVASGNYHGRTNNQFRLKPGQWTDDTSMALCLADSLICRNGLDCSDLQQRFYAWCFGAYNTPFWNDSRRTFEEGMSPQPIALEDMWFFHRGAVGCGTNMSRSLEQLAKSSVGSRPPPAFSSSSEDAGNAPLIRLAAIPVFFAMRPFNELVDAARKSSYSTHPGPVAAECSAFLAFAIREALLSRESTTMAAFLDKLVDDYCARLVTESAAEPSNERETQARDSLLRLLRMPAEEPPPESVEWKSVELAWRWRGRRTWWRRTLANRGDYYNGYPVSSGYVGSFALDGLAMALWAAHGSNSFDEAIERCVNLQGDADSTAAICGALCGSFYGIDTFCRHLVASVQRWDGGGDIALRGVLLWYMGKVYDGAEPKPYPPLCVKATRGGEAKLVCDKTPEEVIA